MLLIVIEFTKSDGGPPNWSARKGLANSFAIFHNQINPN
jgi:hypothetical protein